MSLNLNVNELGVGVVNNSPRQKNTPSQNSRFNEKASRGHNLTDSEIQLLNSVLRSSYYKFRRGDLSEEAIKEFYSLCNYYQSDSSYAASLNDTISWSISKEAKEDAINTLTRNVALVGAGFLTLGALIKYFPALSSAGVFGGKAVTGSSQLAEGVAAGAAGSSVVDTVKDVADVTSDVVDVADKVSDNDNFWQKLFKFFSGDSGLFSGMSATIGGLASELGSSIFNYNQQVKLLDKQNEYNTPKAQMERFADAGLNPNLVYGLGSNGNQPSSGSIAPADFTTAQRENRMAKLNFMLQSKMAQADIGQKMAQTNLLNSQSEGQQLQNQINSSTMQTQINQIEQNYRMSIEQVNNLIEQKKKVISETKNLNIKNMFENDIQRLTKQKMSLENDLTELQSKWQPYLYGTGIFRDVSTGLGSLGVGAEMFGKFFKGLKGNLPKDMQKYGDVFSSFSNSTF